MSQELLNKRFKSVLKARTKAMNVFVKARNNLVNADTAMGAEADNSKRMIENMQKVIDQENEAIKFLDATRMQNKSQLEKVNAFLIDSVE